MKFSLGYQPKRPYDNTCRLVPVYFLSLEECFVQKLRWLVRELTVFPCVYIIFIDCVLVQAQFHYFAKQIQCTYCNACVFLPCCSQVNFYGKPCFFHYKSCCMCKYKICLYTNKMLMLFWGSVFLSKYCKSYLSCVYVVM